MNRHSIRPLHLGGSVSDPSLSASPQGNVRFIARHPAWHSLFRPVSILLLGLAFAVFLWGLAYKLSLYHPHHGHSGRTSVAKLWIGPAPGKQRPGSAKVMSWPPLHRQPNLFATRYSPQSPVHHVAAFVPSDKETHFRLRVLRSPPPRLL
jgi:hypothetical protein